MARGAIESNAVQPSNSSGSLAAVREAIAAVRALRSALKTAAMAEAEKTRQEEIACLLDRIDELVAKHGKSPCEHLNYQQSPKLSNAPY